MNPSLPGSIDISRYSGSDACIRIRLTDDSSGVNFVEVEMSLADFAAAITGRGSCPCTFSLSSTRFVGSTAQNKTEVVPFDMFNGGRDDKAAIKKALKPFEVDGWHAREGDITNGHCRVKDRGVVAQRVVFFRHVDKEGNPIT